MNPLWLERILIRDLETMKKELAAYPDEASVWVTPPGIANSAGTLALHVAGNVRHFIGAILGKSGFVRDRDREFAARDVPRTELVAGLDAAIEAVKQTLGGIDRAALDEPYPELVGGRLQVVTGDFLIHLATHLTFHLGQVGYLRRIVTGGSTSTGAVGLNDLATAARQAIA